MSEEQTGSVLLLALGATAVWLWRSGEALSYVRPGLAPLVLVAGVVLLALGLLPPLGLLGRRAAGPAGDAGAPHRHRAMVGWLLLVPVLVVLLVQPAALGSYAASSRTVVPGGGDGGVHHIAPPRPPYEYSMRFSG